MATKSSNRCIYDECKLPESNNRYWLQLGCLAISFFTMINNVQSFSFLALFMFIVPIAIDLHYADYIYKPLKFLRTSLFVINVILAFICALGLCGFLVDKGKSFEVVNSAIIFAGFTISKKSLTIPLLIDLLIPVSMVYGSPNKKIVRAIKYTQNRQKEGV